MLFRMLRIYLQLEREERRPSDLPQKNIQQGRTLIAYFVTQSVQQLGICLAKQLRQPSNFHRR